MRIDAESFGSQPTDPRANRNGTPTLLSSINPVVEIGTKTKRRPRTAPEFFVQFDRLVALLPFVIERLADVFTSHQLFEGVIDEDYDLYRDALDYHGNRQSSENTVRSMLIFRLRGLNHLVEYVGNMRVRNSSGHKVNYTRWRKI